MLDDLNTLMTANILVNEKHSGKPHSPSASCIVFPVRMIAFPQEEQFCFLYFELFKISFWWRLNVGTPRLSLKLQFGDPNYWVFMSLIELGSWWYGEYLACHSWGCKRRTRLSNWTNWTELTITTKWMTLHETLAFSWTHNFNKQTLILISDLSFPVLLWVI